MDTSGAIIATFGVLIALQAAAGMIWGGDSQAYPQPFGNTAITLFGREWPVSAYDLIVIGFGVVMVVALTLLFTRTSLGLAMRATAFNPEVARLSGIRVSRTLTIGWALAGIVGAVGGVLVAPDLGDLAEQLRHPAGLRLHRGGHRRPRQPDRRRGAGHRHRA